MDCGERINPGDPYLRSFGMAEDEKPWELIMCLKCTDDTIDSPANHKIITALKDWRGKVVR